MDGLYHFLVNMKTISHLDVWYITMYVYNYGHAILSYRIVFIKQVGHFSSPEYTVKFFCIQYARAYANIALLLHLIQD